MRLSAVFLALAGLVAISACDGTKASDDARRPSPAPTAVNCGDAAQLEQRALDDRRRRDETSSDQEKIVAGNRGTFYASLAIVADLKCRVTLAEADEALKPAFDAARKAEATRSFYERAVLWSEAGLIVTQVVPMLMKRLPVPPPK